MDVNFRLKLNQVALLMFPENPQLGIANPCVVQVIVRSIGKTAHRSPTVDDLATFFCNADEISSVVQSVVLGHLTFPDTPAELILKGERYFLRATRKEWIKGKKFWFRWAENIIQAAQEKWVFEMVPTPPSALKCSTEV